MLAFRRCTGLGLPLSSASLNKVVNVDRADRLLVRLVAATINGDATCLSCCLHKSTIAVLV